MLQKLQITHDEKTLPVHFYGSLPSVDSRWISSTKGFMRRETSTFDLAHQKAGIKIFCLCSFTGNSIMVHCNGHKSRVDDLLKNHDKNTF